MGSDKIDLNEQNRTESQVVQLVQKNLPEKVLPYVVFLALSGFVLTIQPVYVSWLICDLTCSRSVTNLTHEPQNKIRASL